MPCSGWQESLQRPHLTIAVTSGTARLRAIQSNTIKGLPPKTSHSHHYGGGTADMGSPQDTTLTGGAPALELATRGEGRNRERRYQKTEEIRQPFPPTDPDEYQFKVVRNHEPIYQGNPSSSRSRLQSRKAVCCSPCHLGLSAFVIKTY